LHLGYFTPRYKHLSAFFKLNNLFIKLAITVDTQSVSILILNNGVLKKWVGPNINAGSNGNVAVKSLALTRSLRALLKENKSFKILAITVKS
jgi:hypothetical protein